jgi:hypothetical protein
MSAAVMRAILPRWTGALPSFFPRHVRFALISSFALLSAWTLLTRGRTFGRLSGEAQQRLIASMARHPSAALRGLVSWWKLVALLTDRSATGAPNRSTTTPTS